MTDPNPQKPSQKLEGFRKDPRVYLAIHPEDAEKVFQSQSSYGKNVTSDFRENVKALSQVYISIQRYLQGIYRREQVFYPELEDVHKDLQIYKRSISDKIPMPTEQELWRYCLQLAAQEPPFIHVIRELRSDKKGEIQFVSQFVAPTSKHEDKVIVAYRSCIDLSIKNLREILSQEKFGQDYARLYSACHSISALPLRKGRADEVFKRIYILESELGKLTEYDLKNLRKVNQEIYKRCYKPILFQGVKDKLILNLSNEEVRKAGFPGADKIYDVTLFNVKQDLLGRYAALAKFLHPKYAEDFLDEQFFGEQSQRFKEGSISEWEFHKSLAEYIYNKAKAQPKPSLACIEFAIEVLRLGAWLDAHASFEKKSEKQNELQAALKKIRNHGTLFRARSAGQWSISENILKIFLAGKVPYVLVATEPYDELPRTGEINLEYYDHIYLLYKDRKITGKAIETAIQLFENNGDTFTLHIIESILGLGIVSESKLKEYVAPIYLDKLRYALSSAYIKYLPFWSRLWLRLTSSRVSDKQIMRIREQRRGLEKQRMAHKRGGKTTLQQEKRQVQKRVQSIAQKRVAETKLTQKENKFFEELMRFLEQEWAHGRYPSASRILEEAKESAADYKRLLGLIDAGAASVKQVVAISTNVETVYGPLKFIQEHRDEIIGYLQKRLEMEGMSMRHEKQANAQKEELLRKDLYKAILNYVQFKVY